MPAHTPWWRCATIYQLYVRSFRDSNGDGFGDLAGAREGLSYLQWLGVDGAWLSPTMPSPDTDWGYDVSDYYAVHPELGTLDELARFVEEARARGISVLLDLVPNHTSDKHAWFADALSGKEAQHRSYYVWAAPKPDGGLPNNWTDATDNPAWSLDDRSGEYYLHNFLPTQPDLNWWDGRVHEEFQQILRYWFDRGIAGFRIDVANGLYKDAQLRDNPPAQPGDHPASRRGKYRPEYSANRPEVHEVYRQWHQIAGSYSPGRLLLGETWDFDLARLASYYGREAPELNLAFNFPFFFSELRAPALSAVVAATLAQLPEGATPVWTASNHDAGRFATRWCAGDMRAVKAALVVLATLPGTLVLYYGDELGLTDVDVPRELQVDKMSLACPERLSRDRCRTPLPWTPEENGGFTVATARPWLPLGEHSTTNVQSERADPGSVLSFWRQLSALRRDGKISGLGALQRVAVDDQVWAYRVGEATTVANLSGRPAKVALPGAGGRLLISSHRD
ncbi:MAG TPA: alpha-amylase family glycosyl hydrolase, partial [Acidimicrobiales bacterium]|nr:alpha-amylase family glycosyl hydrolase [Acidimicrobiales bacterium]